MPLYYTDYHTNIFVNKHLFSVFESPTISVLIFTLAICTNVRKHWHGYWKQAIRPPSRTMLLTQASQTVKFAVTLSFKIKARIEENCHQGAIHLLPHGHSKFVASSHILFGSSGSLTCLNLSV